MFNDIYDDLWATYYAPTLTKLETNQFRQACRRSRSVFLEQIIKPQAYIPANHTYMSLSQSPDNMGRAHHEARDLIMSKAEPIDWVVPQFFTNAMRVAHPTDADYRTPSRRIIVAPYYVITFEYDTPSLPFFQQQLGWFRSSKKPLDSPIGCFLRDIRSQFKDCVGLSVVYSGNKSFHYHFTFSTDLLVQRAGQILSARTGFVEAWQRLAQIMRQSPHLKIPAGFEPDPTLRFPEWYRRLPNGARLLSAPKGKEGWRHFFGVPFGEVVPQCVMWEHLAPRRSGRGVDQASIFEPANFVLPDVARRAQKSARTPIEFVRSGPVQDFCAEKLRDIYPGDTVWPRFEGFMEHNGELRAMFANSQADKQPSSFMGSNFATVFIQGDNPLGLTTDRNGFGTLMPRLPRSLGEMIALWSAEYEASHNPAPPPIFNDRVRSPIEQEFADRATDHVNAKKAIAGVLDEIILEEPAKEMTHFLTAPEGISKTRSLIASTPRYSYSLTLAQKSPLVMYAFDSYAMAEEKCAEFNAEHGQNMRFNARFKGVVLPSFTHLYAEACSDLQVAKITTADAAKHGHPSLMAAIVAVQPEVIAYFRQFYTHLWSRIGKSQPVLFCVHQVAHGWHKSSPTRLMLSRNYWTQTANEDAQARAIRMAQCRMDTALGLLIHDEVSAEKLVLAVPAELVEWVQTMEAASWATNAHLPVQFAAFESYVVANPPPRPISFERAVEVAEVENWETVTTTYSGEYGPQQPRTDRTTGEVHEPIYGAVAGKKWCIAAQPWPKQAAHKTIVLTTEAVPAAIVGKLGNPWTVTELDTPLIPRDVVETKVSKEVISGNLGKLVKAEQEAFKEATGRCLMAISNKAKHVVNSTTHASAKGSNGFMGMDVVQTMSMMAPEQYELYEALNAWTGRADLVLTRHIDEFNQTAGRNLGFRKRGSPKHILLLNSTLSKCLDGEPKARARYIMQEVVTRRQVSAARAPKPQVSSTEVGRSHMKEMRRRLWLGGHLSMNEINPP